MRSYGSAEKPLELVFKPSPNGGVMRMLLIRRGSSMDADQATATVQLGETRINTSLLRYSDDKTHYRIDAANLPMDDFRKHLDVTFIGLSGGVKEAFAASDLPALVAELDKCLLDLQTYWNMGAVHSDRVVAEAKPKQPISQLFSSEDYPAVALRAEQSGVAKIVFLVDEQGAVSDCSIDKTSGVSTLDAMSCYVLQSRAKFDPAIGKDGKPVRSAYCERIAWVVTSGSRPPKWDESSKDPLCPEEPWSKDKR